VIEQPREEEKSYFLHLEGSDRGEITVSLGGRVSLENMSAVMSDLRDLLGGHRPSALRIDLRNVEYMDSAGALVLLQLERNARDRSIPFRYENVSSELKGIMDLLDYRALAVEPLIPEMKAAESGLERVAEGGIRLFSDFFQMTAFLGDIMSALAYSALHPRSIRWSEVGVHVKRAGVQGLPIVGFLSFLLGYIVALMAASQLRQYEFNVLIGAVVGIAMIKEFGPMITTILVAGRSGSAYAAEIGTMKVNEEVDALITIGYDPILFLGVPRVLATLLVVPLLTIYSDLLGLAGGMMVGAVDLNIPPLIYLREVPLAITTFDFATSLLKSEAFAMIIVGVGCQRGFRTRGGAQAVGISTTSALVTTIFLVIITDFLFATIINYTT
jgi:phospholipid/cholesterol/gamma-HCH transport system permease protein